MGERLMEITLVLQSDSIQDKKTKKILPTGMGITQLLDCGMILLHKAGLRPLYVINSRNNEEIHFNPTKKMEKPDLILFSETSEIGKVSAQILQKQLLSGECYADISPFNFSKSETNPKIFKNIIQKRIGDLEKQGFKHIIFVASTKELNRIAYSIREETEEGASFPFPGKNNFPLQSFSSGKELYDENLVNGFYITRDILDTILLKNLKETDKTELKRFKGCKPVLEAYLLKEKIYSKIKA